MLAPITGSVANLNITLGESIEDRGTKLMSVVDNQEVLATANIPEQNLGRVKVGQQVRVKVAGIPNQTFVSRIAQIDPTVAGDTRVVAVRAKLNNASGVLKPGMFAELEVLTDRAPEPVLAVPTSAVIDANGKQLVYIENGTNSYQPVDVTLGQTFGDLVAIQGSLFEGDRIVTEGATMLYAQSLRGGTPKPEPAATDTPEEASQGISKDNFLLMLLATTAIATIAFFLGSRTGRKPQDKKELIYQANHQDLPLAKLDESITASDSKNID